MLTDNYLRNLNNNLKKMLKQHTQIATGSRITKLSDDPVGAINVMNTGSKLERIEQYKTNISRAESWNQLTESSVMELNDIVKNAYEKAIQAANDHITPADKNAIAEEVGQLRDHLLSAANNQSGNKFLFGGFNTINPPFEVDSATGNLLYNGIAMSNPSDPALLAEAAQVTEFEVAYSVRLGVSISGPDLIGTGDDNIYAILDDMYNSLKADDSADVITGYADKLQNAQSRLLNLESVIGGRTNRLELIKNRHEEDDLNYTEIRSDIKDVDQAEALLQFSVTESIYTASLGIAAKILTPTLVEFLS
jgi:flagellar hook-associated protein 3 FlgL